MKKKIIAIKSYKGDYFEIGINSRGYYLKNDYTKIPNEFKLYDKKEIKQIFLDLCAKVENDCIEVKRTNSNEDKDAYFSVVFSDKSESIYKSKISRYFGFDAIIYTDLDGMKLNSLRKALKSKVISYDDFVEFLSHAFLGDDDALRDSVDCNGNIDFAVWYYSEYNSFEKVSPTPRITSDGTIIPYKYSKSVIKRLEEKHLDPYQEIRAIIINLLVENDVKVDIEERRKKGNEE